MHQQRCHGHFAQRGDRHHRCGQRMKQKCRHGNGQNQCCHEFNGENRPFVKPDQSDKSEQNTRREYIGDLGTELDHEEIIDNKRVLIIKVKLLPQPSRLKKTSISPQDINKLLTGFQNQDKRIKELLRCCRPRDEETLTLHSQNSFSLD